MKILHLIPRFTIGGAERLVLEYAEWLPEYGFEVKVLSVRQAGAMRRLRSLVREWRPDIIHTHIFSSDVAGYLLKCSSAQVRWVSTQHNVPRQHSWWRRVILRVILKRADRVIAVAPRVAGKVLIPNAIAINEWLAVPTAGLLTNKILRLAVIGRLERQKGIDLLLNALSGLKQIDWRLSVFGDGSLEAKLKKQARQLGLEKRITWHGAVADLPRRLPEIDIVIQPSRWEGMSLAVMEAMAAGRIVIASEAAGEGLIEPMKTGIIFGKKKWVMSNGKLGNNGIAKWIKWVDGHRQEANQMAERGREYAIENFGMDLHLRRLAKLYCDLGGGPLDRRK